MLFSCGVGGWFLRAFQELVKSVRWFRGPRQIFKVLYIWKAWKRQNKSGKQILFLRLYLWSYPNKTRSWTSTHMQRKPPYVGLELHAIAVYCQILICSCRSDTLKRLVYSFKRETFQTFFILFTLNFFRYFNFLLHLSTGGKVFCLFFKLILPIYSFG